MKEKLYGLNFNGEISLADSYEKFINEINTIITSAEECRNMINDFDNLTDKEYYELTKKYPYGTKLDHGDYIKIIELANDKKYEKPISIKTALKTLVPVDTGYGKHTKTKLEHRAVDLKVLYEENSIDSTKRYTKSEIEELINNKKLVVLKTEIDWNNNEYDNYEDCPVYNGVYDFSDIKWEFEKPEGRYYNAMLKYNKIRNNKERLEEIYKELVFVVRAKLYVRQALETDFEEKGFQKKLGELENK